MRVLSLLRIRVLCLMILICTSTRCGRPLGQPRYVSNTPSVGSMKLVADGHAATLCVAYDDYPGVLRAARDLQSDIQRVSGLEPSFCGDLQSIHGEIVIIGTIGKSKLLDQLVHAHKIDVSEIAGKWESTLVQVVNKPTPGVERALVIAGSDKRGTIFGIYDISEQIGVSPWYWWADVPVQHKDVLYISPGTFIQGEPAVKYRGIFLNDEAPALTGWVNANYGGYNHRFYVKVFELLLRLRANYLWPAMWNSAFNEDDPENARLADEYGIVMGTSHHEPMLRAQQEWKRHGDGPWNYSTNAAVLDKFWSEGIERNKNFESTITLGMRGDGDMPMADNANITLLEKIVDTQRQILNDHMTPTLAADPKVWALYKEVQTYYEKGMRVPEDVTLLWCDDNWGNIRRLPTAEECKRSGGAGIYYHFDYVGDPRNYKWINTNPIEKVWEQMNLALKYGANRIWIVNVGDLKPMEFPIEYFLTLARNPERWGKDQSLEFTRLWAAREFGEGHANEIAELVETYTRYNGRRKPELLDVDTYSLINYREADRIEEEWRILVKKAEEVQRQLPAAEQDAYFELVLHPIKASAIVSDMYISAGRNRLYSRQGRADANDFASETRELFNADGGLTNQYNHTLANGKWNHMMDQTHLGYTYWQEPPLNVMPAVSEVQPAPEAAIGVVAEGSPDPIQAQHLSFDSFQKQTHFIDIFNRGLGSLYYSTKSDVPWISLSAPEGDVAKETRVEVTVDWTKVRPGKHEGKITVRQRDGLSVVISVEALNPESITLDSLNGFVEGDGYVSIEAEHFTNATNAGEVHWDRIPGYGATLSGMTIFPVTADSVKVPQSAAKLQYRVYLFDSGSITLQTTLSPTLNFVPGRGLRFAVWFDDQPPQIVDALEHNTESDWAKSVSDEVRRVETKLSVSQPGYHTLNFAMVDPGIVLEKLVVSAGQIKPSYLGPPESVHRSNSRSANTRQ
jgi:hypothetical protein